MRAILLNGPPRSGKDTIGEMLWNALPASRCMKFSQDIIDFMFSEYGIGMESVSKDEVHPKLYGRTPREVAIRYSEGFCKPLFGINYFGHRTVKRLLSMLQQPSMWKLAILTDSGFVDEALPVVDALGPTNVLQVALTRPGCTFAGDSRNYWEHPSIGRVEFDNDCPDLTALQAKVKADLLPEIQKWLAHSF